MLPSNLQSSKAATRRSAAKQRSAQFIVTVSHFDDLMIQAAGCHALTPQAHLILSLLIQGSIPMKDAMLHNPLSYRAFYNMLNKLKKLAVVCVEVDSCDRRIRRLVLSPKFEPIRAYLLVR
jgi:hypothetical protein